MSSLPLVSLHLYPFEVQHGQLTKTSPRSVNDITKRNGREFGHMTHHIIVSITLSDIGITTAENPSIHLKYACWVCTGE